MLITYFAVPLLPLKASTLKPSLEVLTGTRTVLLAVINGAP